MTTNIGSHIIQDNFEKLTEDNVLGILETTKLQVYELLKKSVRPEFLNRVDETIMFRPLSQEDLRKIVRIQFQQIKQRIEAGGISVDITDEVLDYLARVGFDPQFGARPLKRVMQREILNELSKEMIAEHIVQGDEVNIELENDKIAFNKVDHVEVVEE
jgi:ATP-dependent Clp protease ATP-binding subunit ClpB